MRKMLALLLVVVLVFALASVVFANENTPSPTGTTAADPSTPSESTSPNTGAAVPTGDMMFLLLAPIMLLGVFGVIVATRKLVKNH